MSKKSRLFKALTVILSLAILVSSLTVSVFADYSIYKPDGKTFKDNAYIKGNDTAIIYIPGYRCSNLETEFNGKRVVCFAVGTEVFEVSENNSFIENFINGFANLLISGVMLLTNSFRNEDVNVSKDGGFGISDIYVRFFETCVEKYGKESDVIIYDLDWRQDLRITVDDLYSIINAQGYKKVILVTQSMGGLIASGTAKLLRDDLNDENPDNDVDLYTVNVGAAFFGSFDFFYNKTEFKGI
ncbi:MAG: alpha/beta hydrolase, partial [Clostridia bacterium]|nr:alpha/beta hydrolase [Clostridia bacterium]